MSLWREVPLPMKVWIVVAPVLGLGLVGFLVWAVYRLVMHYT